MSGDTIFADYAPEYASMGLAVFPLIPRDKFPLKGTHGELDASNDPDEVARMAAGVPKSNIGIAPAASGLFVVDIDPRNNGDKTLATFPPLPETLTTNTGGGGQHYWFRRPPTLDETTCTNIGPGVDIKGLRAGYVVAPPSIHPSGRAYEWANTAPIAEAPDWLVQKILASGKARKEHTALSAPVDADSFLLGRAFGRMGWLGPQIKNGVFAVLCPNEGLHSGGKPLSGGTVIFAPEDGGPGVFFCSHTSHCKGLGKDILSRLRPDLITEHDCAELAARCKETDLGNSERLGIRYGQQIKYCKPLRTWFVWNGRQWEEDDAKVQELAKSSARKIWREIDVLAALLLEDEGDKKKMRRATHAKNSEKASNIAAAMSLASSAHAVSVGDLDADLWLLNVQNGTIDLRTGVLRPHARDDLITKIGTCDYDPFARSALWETFLAGVTGGDTDLAAYLQRAIGCALVGEAHEKAFWFIYGPPDGAKSTFISVVSEILGDYHVASDADTWLLRPQLGGNRGDIVRLRGARLTTVVEIKKDSKFDEQLIKAVTGGDVLTQAAKYKDEISFKPTFSLWFAANDCPAIRDDDTGMWKRVRRVPFTNVIPKAKQDPNMRHRLRTPEVQRAILTWAVQGCLEWQRSGLGTCKAVEQSSEEYRNENDKFGEFFEGSCVFEPGAEVSRTALYSQFEFWCRSGSTKLLTPKEFAGRIRGRPGVGEKMVHGVRSWTGVRLATAAEQVGLNSNVTRLFS